MKCAPAVPLTLLALTLTACHSSQPAPSVQPAAATKPAVAATAIANPCSLASVDEVSAAMGRKSNPGEFHQVFNGNRCNFYDASSQYEIFLQTVDWGLAGPMMTPQNTVAGIGDQAFWSDGSVYVRKGGHALMIGFQLPHVLPSLTPPTEQFAKLVAGRM